MVEKRKRKLGDENWIFWTCYVLRNFTYRLRIFEKEKNRYIRFKEIPLKDDQIAFQNSCLFVKILKIDGTMTIIMGGYGVNLSV